MSTYPIFRTNRENQSDFPITKKEKSNSLFAIYASQFIEFRDALKVARETFSQEQIWPDQCDYVIYKIKPVKNAATSIVNSVKKQRGKLSSYNRYPLLVSAHYLFDQVELLIEFIREYREIAEDRSTKRSKQRMIVSALHNLDSSLHDLMQELDETMQN